MVFVDNFSNKRYTPTHVGKTFPPPLIGCISRYTPTHVGKTFLPHPYSHYHPVHPHTRGENVPEPFWPVMWLRYTPTHVGKTKMVWKSGYHNAVHPHTRGENLNKFKQTSSARGTPPHTWGKLDKVYQSDSRTRYTPTHVGKTPGFQYDPTMSTVHPHTRGENSLQYSAYFSSAGTPPHTWGKLCSNRMFDGVLTVHPHTRGENFAFFFKHYPKFGTPPHTWGKQHGRMLINPALRYTPTHVGKTLKPNL